MSLIQGVPTQHGRIRKALASAVVIAIVPGALAAVVGYGIYRGAKVVSRHFKSFSDNRKAVHLASAWRH